MERAARNGADPASAWAAVKGRAGEIPDHERTRLRFVADRRHHVADDSHPPTVYRRRLIEQYPVAGQISLPRSRSERIDDQLQAQFAVVWRAVSRS